MIELIIKINKMHGSSHIFSTIESYFNRESKKPLLVLFYYFSLNDLYFFHYVSKFTHVVPYRNSSVSLIW